MWLIVFFLDLFSLCNPCCPGTHYVQACFQLTEISLLPPPPLPQPPLPLPPCTGIKGVCHPIRSCLFFNLNVCHDSEIRLFLRACCDSVSVGAVYADGWPGTSSCGKSKSACLGTCNYFLASPVCNCFNVRILNYLASERNRRNGSGYRCSSPYIL